MGEKAKNASMHLSSLNVNKRNAVLKQFVQYLRANKKSILKLNKKDVLNAKSKKIRDNLIERLQLNNKKIDQIINSIKKIIKFKDPLNKILSSKYKLLYN